MFLRVNGQPGAPKDVLRLGRPKYEPFAQLTCFAGPKGQNTVNLRVLGAPAGPKGQNTVNLRVLGAPADQKSQNTVNLHVLLAQKAKTP